MAYGKKRNLFWYRSFICRTPPYAKSDFRRLGQNQTMDKMKRTEGFTLIELLVVITIIALLLAITAPALNKAKIYAEEVVCKSNLRQYYLATELYATDNDERFPYPWKSLYKETIFPGEVQRYCRWHNPVYNLDANPEKYGGPYWPYLASTAVNICPVFRKIAPKYGSSHFTGCIGEPFEPQFSYSMNGLFSENGNGIPKAQIASSPSQTFLWAEENMWLLTGLCTNVLNDNALCADGRDCFASFHKISTAQLSVQRSTNQYNTGKSNVLLMDGSLVFLSPTESIKYAGRRR